MRDDREYETGGNRVLWWVLWAGIGAATAGEVLLFALTGAAGGERAAQVGHLPASQFVVVATLAVGFALAAVGVERFRIGGGGFPTALLVWALLKAIAIAGLIVYQLADNHRLYWPFLAVFALGMLWANPRRFGAGDDK